MNLRPRLAIVAAAWGLAVGGACAGCGGTLSADSGADASDGISEVASEGPNLALADAPAPGSCRCPSGPYFVEIDTDGAALTLAHRGAYLPDWCAGLGPDTPMAQGSKTCDPTVSL